MNKPASDGVNCAGLILNTWQASGLGGYDRAMSSSGSGEPLHFLHGNGFCGLTLAPLAGALSSPDQPLLFTDLPGHGIAPTPEATHPDWNDMGRRVADSLASRSDRPVTAIGHSMGGVVTLLAAAQFPDLFRRVVLLDPVLFIREIVFYQRVMRVTGLWRRRALVRSANDRRSSWPDKLAMAEDLGKKRLYRDWHPDALQAFVDYGSCDDGQSGVRLACSPQWEAANFGAYPRKLWHAISTVKVPVDIVVASKSYPFIPPAVRRAVASNPAIKAHQFEGGHCFPMEFPEVAGAFISDILKESEQRR